MADITIIIPSYNRGDYISQALDSIFMQECSYQYNIVVADDCSVDNTLEIVKEYQKKHPGKITLITSEKNQKLYKNILRAYKITKSDYFCVLDPDDYWIDKKKIQKALDFLEAKQDYNIYTGNTKIVFPNGSEKLWSYNKISSSYTFKDFLKGRILFGHTSSSVFRNVIFKGGMPEKLINLTDESQEQSFRGDSFRNFIHICDSKIKYMPEITSVYRVTSNGLWQSLSEFDRDLLSALFFKNMWLYFDKKYPELLVRSYRIVNKIKYSIFLLTGNGIAEFKNPITIESITKLENIYRENIEIIKSNSYKDLKFINKIRIIIYRKLRKKLMKYGIFE